MKKQRILVIFVLIISFVLFYVNKTTTTLYCTFGGKNTFTVTFNQILQTIYEMKHTDNYPKQDFYFEGLKNLKTRNWINFGKSNAKAISKRKYSEYDELLYRPNDEVVSEYEDKTYGVPNPNVYHGLRVSKYWMMPAIISRILKKEHEDKYRGIRLGKTDVKINKSLVSFSNEVNYFVRRPIYRYDQIDSEQQPIEDPLEWVYMMERDNHYMDIDRINGNIELRFSTINLDKESFVPPSTGAGNNYSGKCSTKKEF